MDPSQSASNIHSSESDTQGPGGGSSREGHVPGRGVPVPAPLLLLDGSLHRCLQPSKQHKVPFGHLLLSTHMFLSPMKQRRFVGGLGQEFGACATAWPRRTRRITKSVLILLIDRIYIYPRNPRQTLGMNPLIDSYHSLCLSYLFESSFA